MSEKNLSTQTLEKRILERRIKARAALLGLSVTDIARLGDVSTQSLFTWLKSGITPKGVQVVCDVLGVNSDWIKSQSADDVGVGITAAWAVLAAENDE